MSTMRKRNPSAQDWLDHSRQPTVQVPGMRQEVYARAKAERLSRSGAPAGGAHVSGWHQLSSHRSVTRRGSRQRAVLVIPTISRRSCGPPLHTFAMILGQHCAIINVDSACSRLLLSWNGIAIPLVLAQNQFGAQIAFFDFQIRTVHRPSNAVSYG